MNLMRAFRLFARKPTTLVEPPAVDVEEARQLDLLLTEINEHEQQLSPNYWASAAQSFANKMAASDVAQATRRTSRYSQLKPYLTSLLPIGGLLALAGLAFTDTQGVANTSDGLNETIASTTRATETAQARSLLRSAKTTGEANSPVAEQHPAVGARSADATTKPHQRAARQRTTHQTRLSTQSASNVPAPAFEPSHGLLASTVAASPLPRTPTATPQPSAESDTFAEQLQALKHADRALKNGDTLSAKAALTRPFSPQLVLHANSLRAVLACQSNDGITGKRYLNAQAKSHPNSPYLDRMRRACGVDTSMED